MIDVCPFKFEELPERDGSASIDHENIRFLVTKMFKVFKGISSSNCKRDLSYQLKNRQIFKSQLYTVFSGTQKV